MAFHRFETCAVQIKFWGVAYMVCIAQLCVGFMLPRTQMVVVEGEQTSCSLACTIRCSTGLCRWTTLIHNFYQWSCLAISTGSTLELLCDPVLTILSAIIILQCNVSVILSSCQWSPICILPNVVRCSLLEKGTVFCLLIPKVQHFESKWFNSR